MESRLRQAPHPFEEAIGVDAFDCPADRKLNRLSRESARCDQQAAIGFLMHECSVEIVNRRLSNSPPPFLALTTTFSELAMAMMSIPLSPDAGVNLTE